MNCKNVEMLISAYLDGEVTASQWKEAQAHIASCAGCSATLTAFQRSTDLVKQELTPRDPAGDLWAGIAARIRHQKHPSRASLLINRMKQLLEDYILRPIPAVRYAQVGIAFAALLMFMIVQFQRGDSAKLARSVEPEQIGMSVETGLAPFGPEKPQRPRLILASSVEKYLEKANVLLLEVKNGEAMPDSAELMDFRQTSQNLLEETILIKKDLKDADLTLLKKTVEQLEMILFDIANLSQTPEDDEIDLVKAVILQKDLLIKIEIYDAKDIENNLGGSRFQSKREQPYNRQKI